MSQAQQEQDFVIPDWDATYREGTPPWDSGIASGELVRVLDEGLIRPGPVLEFGCGTGADAVYLAERGFEVTAVDSSPIALERARRRAQQEGALVRFVLDDVFDFAQTAGQFDFVYDAGFYHFMRHGELERFLDMLWRITRPGSLYLTLAGNSRERTKNGPPRVSRDDIRIELGRLFEPVQLRTFRFESLTRSKGHLGWSCLMRRL